MCILQGAFLQASLLMNSGGLTLIGGVFLFLGYFAFRFCHTTKNYLIQL